MLIQEKNSHLIQIIFGKRERFFINDMNSFHIFIIKPVCVVYADKVVLYFIKRLLIFAGTLTLFIIEFFQFCYCLFVCFCHFKQLLFLFFLRFSYEYIISFYKIDFNTSKNQSPIYGTLKTSSRSLLFFDFFTKFFYNIYRVKNDLFSVGFRSRKKYFGFVRNLMCYFQISLRKKYFH